MNYKEIKAVIDCLREADADDLTYKVEKSFRKLSEDSTQDELDKFVKFNSGLFAQKSDEQKLIEEYISTSNELNILSKSLAEVGEVTPSSMLDGLAGVNSDFDAERKRIKSEIDKVTSHLEEVRAKAEKYAYYDAHGKRCSILKG